MGIQGVQEGTEDTPLWGPHVEDQCRGGNVAYLHHLRAARPSGSLRPSYIGVQSQGCNLCD